MVNKKGTTSKRIALHGQIIPAFQPNGIPLSSGRRCASANNAELFASRTLPSFAIAMKGLPDVAMVGAVHPQVDRSFEAGPAIGRPVLG